MAENDAAEAVPDDSGDYEDDEDAPAAGPSGGRKRLIIIAAAVLVLIGIGVGVFFSGILDSVFGTEEQAGRGDQPFVPGQVFYKLEEITINLNDEGGKPTYLRLGVTVVLVNEADVPVIEVLQPRIVDFLSSYLRELRPDELAGSASFYRLRENLLTRVRAAVAPIPVTNVLFSTALVQ